MTNKLFKFEIDAPATVNKVSSIQENVDKDQGSMFRIEKAWLSVPDLDAIAATDLVQFQLSTQSQSEAAALYEIDSEYEIYTFALDFHLAEAAITTFQDPNKCIEMTDIAGTMIKGKFYLNSLITGQDGAIPMKVKLLGQHVKTNVDEWQDNSI